MSQPSLEHSLRNYYAEVERGLVCSGSVKRRTVQALRTSVEDFLAGSPDASFADVVERFGTPGQIADEALEALSPAELRRYARQSHMMWCALVLFIGGFFFLGLCAFAIPAIVSAVESIQIDPSEVFQMTVTTATIVWLVLTIAFLVLEAVTVSLVSIWLAVGALVALLVSLLVPSVPLQMAVFAAVSIVALLVTRPLVKKHVSPMRQATNADMNVGKRARVIRRITPEAPGRVRLEGVDWAARSATTIPEGSWCVVTAVESATLEVVPEPAPATV